MKKFIFKLTLLIYVLLSSNFLNAQVSFSHSLGASTFFAINSSGIGFMYSPRLNFLELSDEMTLSMGTHFTVGFSGTANSQTGASGSFCFDLPLVAEINLGHAANTNSKSNFGGFLGLGLGYNRMAYTDNTVFGANSGSFVASGFVFNGGVRTIIKERSVGARVSYLVNAVAGKSNVIGLGVFYTFGMD